MLAGGMFGTESQIESSYPSDAESWTVSWYPDREDFASPAIGGSIPYAICVDDPPDGFVQVLSESNNCDHDGPSCLTFAGCPDGTFVFGAAFYGYQSKVESFAPADPWSTIVTWYPASHEYASGADGIGIAIALCATGTYPINDPVFFNGFDP